MIDCLVFSKNRPMQLELLIRSILGNIFEIRRINVYYRSDDEYQKNYMTMFNQYDSHVKWWRQESNEMFKSNVMDIYSMFNAPYTVIFVDDDVVINHVDLDKILRNFKPYHQSVSLSLGLSCNYCYAQGYKQQIPQNLMVLDGIIQWQWTFAEPKTDWAYPMTFDGGIYQTDWLVEKTSQLKFDSPNMYAGMLDAHKDWNKNYQLAFTQQKVFNVAANLVQTVCNNRHGEKYKYTIEDLNKKFSGGQRISMKNLQGQTFNSPNGEIEYEFIGF